MYALGKGRTVSQSRGTAICEAVQRLAMLKADMRQCRKADMPLADPAPLFVAGTIAARL